MLGLNVNYPQISKNQYNRQQNTSNPIINKFSNSQATQMGDTVSFGTNVIQKIEPFTTQEAKAFLKENFQSNSHKNGTIILSNKTFARAESEKVLAQFRQARDKARKGLRSLNPEKFDEWAKKLIQTDEIEGEINCLNPEADSSILFFKRFQPKNTIDTYDKRINKGMRYHIFKEEREGKFPVEIRLEDGTKWSLTPNYDEYLDTTPKIYTELKFSKID